MLGIQDLAHTPVDSDFQLPKFRSNDRELNDIIMGIHFTDVEVAARKPPTYIRSP